MNLITKACIILVISLAMGSAFSQGLEKRLGNYHQGPKGNNHITITRTGVAQPGSEIHDRLKVDFDGVSDFYSVQYTLELPDNLKYMSILDMDLNSVDADRPPSQVFLDSLPPGAQLDGSAKQKQQSANESSTMGFGDEYPEPPAGGGSMNETWTWNNPCFNTGIQGLANVTLTYTWRNRDDTDGDGITDSNPGWVLTDENVQIYQPNQAPSQCI